MANSNLVPQSFVTVLNKTLLHLQERRHPDSPLEEGRNTPQNKNHGRNSIGKNIDNLKINTTAKNLLLASWKPSTHRQYSVHISKWENYCKEQNLDCVTPDIEHVVNFLTHLYESGLGYSAINSARSALSTVVVVDGKPVEQHALVIRSLKGIFNLQPSLPKNIVTWDPAVVTKYLKTLSPVANLKLLDLSHKTAMLLLLLTGQRGQSIHLIDIRNLTVTNHYVKIRFGDAMKTTRPGFQQKELNIKAYAPDRRLCIVTVLKEYLERTKDLRKGTQLFVGTNKPHRSVSRDTISRWIKTVMRKAGLDVSIFTPHSVRAASTSAAARSKIPLSTILDTAGWSKDNTFRKYYNRPLEKDTMSESIVK